MRQGKYIIIDSGGGTTDMAYIDLEIDQSRNPKILSKSYGSIIQAGNSVNDLIKHKIGFSKIHSRLRLSLK